MRSAGGAEAARFHIAAIGDDVPLLSFALERHVQLAGEGQIRSMSGATLALTVETLAVVLEQRVTGDLIADGAAGAAAGIRLAQFFSPSSFAMEPMFGTTFFQPSPMLFHAESFFGVTKPEWTSCRRVPVSTLVSVQATTVFNGEP